MSNARNAFFARLKAYQQATEADIIVSRAPVEVDHNARARLLRNGLAVVAFALLEDFIRTRTGEVVGRIGSGATRFLDLPEGIKTAATAGVINALRFQHKFIDTKTVDIYQFYQAHSSRIASTATSPYEISQYAFAHEQTNLSSKDVEAILEAFRVNNPWSAIGSISIRVGVGIPSLKSSFDNAASRRHVAAHRADANAESTDLIAFRAEAIGIAIGFDLLISKALRYILDADAPYLSNAGQVAARHVRLRTLQYDGKLQWREFVEGRARAFRRDSDFDALRVGCLARARVSTEAVVVKDDRGIPTSWFTPDTD